MRLIRPIAVNGANLVSSNVVEDPASLYNPATTYALDQIVHDDHIEYQSLQAGNIGHSLAAEDWWLAIGPTNRFRMFDQSNSSATTNADSIVVEVQVDGRADAISILNIVAATVRVEMIVTAGTIYDETINLVSNSGVTNWYEYFFEPVIRKGDVTLYDMPLNADPIIRVTIEEPGGTASVGALVIGQSRDLGPLLQGARLGIQDYSRKVADDFGNFTIVQRAFSKRATFRILLNNDQVDALSALLASYRATPVVWVGVEKYTASWIYGFYRDFNVELALDDQSYLTLELEGLT